ncbi:MAG: acetyl-CoA carboxylase carboxyltransferase subunit beta [Phycisphaerales bacterium]|nr:acetyl-CoA carboxylase carboxyltransferase subunit beta [Phycisphaerales bacterium]
MTSIPAGPSPSSTPPDQTGIEAALEAVKDGAASSERQLAIAAAAPTAKGESARTWTEVKPQRKSVIPEGLWLRCPGCEQMIYRKQMEANAHVCPECGHHFRISAAERVRQLTDPGSFEPLFTGLSPTDPLKFRDLKPYPDRILAEQLRTGATEAVKAGTGFIKGRAVLVCCMDLTFMMGSMGSVVGEAITRSIEMATERELALVIVSCSGGARMQEAGLSLMQMAKTSAALARHDDAGGLYISVLTDPTTGGVTASFAMLGDVIFAEPRALIGFAGPRVIQQTIRQELPEGFQRSEYLLKGGMVDRVVPRHELRNEIARVIDFSGR